MTRAEKIITGIQPIMRDIRVRTENTEKFRVSSSGWIAIGRILIEESILMNLKNFVSLLWIVLFTGISREVNFFKHFIKKYQYCQLWPL